MLLAQLCHQPIFSVSINGVYSSQINSYGRIVKRSYELRATPPPGYMIGESRFSELARYGRDFLGRHRMACHFRTEPGQISARKRSRIS